TAPSYFKFDLPSWNFLFSEIDDQEDVEILLQGDFNHWVTLTKISWDDKNDNGIIDANEGYIDFIDPDGGDPKTHLNSAGILQSRKGGIIQTDYRSMNFSTKIVTAVSESPFHGHFPEPGSLTISITGLAALCWSSKWCGQRQRK